MIETLSYFVSLITGALLISTLLPWTMVVILPVIFSFWRIVVRYRILAVEFRRMDVSSSSKIQTLTSEGKINFGQDQTCVQHSDAFLQSVRRVVSLLGGPCADLKDSIHQSNDELQQNPMLKASINLERAKQSHAKAKQVYDVLLIGLNGRFEWISMLK